MATVSQVNRAGKVLRTWLSEDTPLASSEVQQALLLLDEFRADHSTPLLKATNGLRSMVRSEGCQVNVTQRLKRHVTILNKLARERNMALSKMQDIGGCRAILNSVAELRRVQARLERNRRPVRVSDYISQPRETGYRAVHVVVEYDGRCIEVQLRTRLMHEWAVYVEELDGQFGLGLKNGEGPLAVREFLVTASEAMAIEETTDAVNTRTMDRLRALQQNALAALSALQGTERT